MKDISTSTLIALLGCTFVTGLIDAGSVLGMGHVFVANMTGNVVFLGFSLFAKTDIVPRTALLALFAFLTGAVMGGRGARNGPTGRRNAFVLEVALMLVAGTLVRTTVSNGWQIGAGFTFGIAGPVTGRVLIDYRKAFDDVSFGQQIRAGVGVAYGFGRR